MVDWLDGLIFKANGTPLLIIIDDASCHFAEFLAAVEDHVKKGLKIYVAYIPAGCTHHLQLLDTDVFSAYKALYKKKFWAWCRDKDRDFIMDMSELDKRVLCARLVAETWKQIVQHIFPSQDATRQKFLKRGYVWDSLFATLKIH
eukprot:gene234-11078_t